MDHPVDDRVSNPGLNPSFNTLIDQIISRRSVLKSSLGLAAFSLLGGFGLTACKKDDDDAPPTPPPERMLGFKSVAVSTGDAMVVASGYVAEPFLLWGEPINSFGPAFQSDAGQGWEAQEQQIGDNHDGMSFFPLDGATTGKGTTSDEGLLVINHEYINPEYFYKPEADATNWLAPFTYDKVRKALAAHGVSVVHIKRASNGTWSHVKSSSYNRRITGYTPMTVSGPAAGNDLLKTAADPTGRNVLGTLNNCANGMTPWGTYLTCEENFNGYFGSRTAFTGTILQNRYGISAGGFGYNWHSVDDRFEVNLTPNETNRFGWVVEIDPFNPGSTPIKRTALGRFKHENAATVVAANGKVVVYMGDDERNEYLYKFVSSGTFSAVDPLAVSHRSLLDAGTLYVAKFEAGAVVGDQTGTGTWIPLIFDQNGLTVANGFTSQADVVIRARQAADRVGATMMDRPEWVTANPQKPGEVYLACTNNNRRGTTTASSNSVNGSTTAGSARPPIDEANPRAVNDWGQIVRWNETGADATATTFTWDLFVVAGNPTLTGDKVGSSNINTGNTFNSPDGIGFDSFGRLWIETDGNFSNVGNYASQGNNQMLAADPKTKEIRRFLVGPSGCEITGLTFTPDRKTMFINIQHPGEVSSHPNKPAAYTGDNWIARNALAFSTWPEGATASRPRSATVVIRRTDGGVIGEGDYVDPTPAAPTAVG